MYNTIDNKSLIDAISYLDNFPMADTSASNAVKRYTLSYLSDALYNYQAGRTHIADCLVATTTALTVTYSNGTSGVGATLTNAGTQAAIAIDGVTLALNDRVLVKNQAALAQNGIYKATTLGDGSHNWVLTRVTDYDQASEMVLGTFTNITSGSTNAGTVYVNYTAGTIVVGTTAINFTRPFNALISSTGSLVTSGSFNGVLTLTADTNVTLPTSGTLVNTISSTIAFTGGSIDGVTIGATTPVTAQGHRPQVTVSGTSKTLGLTDADTYQITTNGSTTTITVDTNANVAFPTNTEIDFFQQGAGQLVFAAAGGVTIQSASSNLKIAAQYSGATLKKTATNTWSLVGNLTA